MATGSPTPWSISLNVDEETKVPTTPGSSVKLALQRAMEAQGFLAATPSRKEQLQAMITQLEGALHRQQQAEERSPLRSPDPGQQFPNPYETKSKDAAADLVAKLSLPFGWKAVASKSRPGHTTYVNVRRKISAHLPSSFFPLLRSLHG